MACPRWGRIGREWCHRGRCGPRRNARSATTALEPSLAPEETGIRLKGPAAQNPEAPMVIASHGVGRRRCGGQQPWDFWWWSRSQSPLQASLPIPPRQAPVRGWDEEANVKRGGGDTCVCVRHTCVCEARVCVYVCMPTQKAARRLRLAASARVAG